MKFDWDDANRRHIARHGIAPEEAEEAILLEPLDAAAQESEGESRTLCFGRTKSGRLLTVLYVERRDTIRVVTAYRMTKAQQRLYFEER
ncbi:MAG: BrnT family toxin [Bryobacteraceae bacterium]